MSTESRRPAAFLDRDGTLIVEHGFLSDLARIEPLPDAVAAVRLLNTWDYLVIGVSNQSGVARGYFGEDTVRAVNARVKEVFAEQSARIDALYFCPHYPKPDEPACDCRKPGPGLIRQAMRDFDIDLARSLVVGDRPCDIGLGRGLDLPSVLVLTGYGREEWAAWGNAPQPDHVAETLYDAVRWWGGRRGML